MRDPRPVECVETKRQPSKWITLNALRVLTAFCDRP